jgi:hypothetical protein
MQQYKQLFVGSASLSVDPVRPGRTTLSWDLCGPCTGVVREFVTDKGDVTARGHLLNISKVLADAGIKVDGLNSVPVAVATLAKQLAECRDRRDKSAALPATEQPTNEG